MSLRSSNKQNYKIWALDEIADVAQIEFSPCATRVALVSKKSLKVLQLNFVNQSIDQISTFYSDFEIEDIKWSPNSQSVLVLSLQDCQFIVVQCSDQDSIFRVQEPSIVNLISVEWVPDSNHLISISRYNIYAFAHSLYDGRRILLPSICSTADTKPLLAFSYDGKYVAFINFQNSAYHIILMSTSSWSILWNKKSEHIMIKGLEWCPNSSMLAAWDCCKNVSFHDLNGEMLRVFHYDDFRISSYLTSTFSPESDLFVAVCSKDKGNVFLIYNLITLQLSAVLNDTMQSKLSLGSCVSPVETEYSSHGSHPLKNSFPAKSQLAFSCCGAFLATSIKRGHVIIWNVREGFKSIEVFNIQNSFAGLQWHLQKTQLAVATEHGTVLVWKCPQDGPVTKTAKLFSKNVNLSPLSTITWSKSNIIISSLRIDSQRATVLIKNKKKK